MYLLTSNNQDCFYSIINVYYNTKVICFTKLNDVKVVRFHPRRCFSIDALTYIMSILRELFCDLKGDKFNLGINSHRIVEPLFLTICIQTSLRPYAVVG